MSSLENARIVMQISLRTGPIVAAAVASFFWNGSPSMDAVASMPVIYNTFAARPAITPHTRIRLLDSGLPDGRGIAYDETSRLLVADAWDFVFAFPLAPGTGAPKRAADQKVERLPATEVCPGSAEGCTPVEHGGLVFN